MDLGTAVIKNFFLRRLTRKTLRNFFVYIPFWMSGILILEACARQGTPSGGDKDTQPPRIIREIPPSGTVNFRGNKIVIKFDEFIQLDNPFQNILISPPLTQKPKIKPVGYADKTLEIKFKEPLRPNTTYTVYFNRSIKDFHEGNVLEDYTYVFSTGPELDSFQLKGKVTAAYDFKFPEHVLVALYPDSIYSPRQVLNGKPYYLATVDKNGEFSLKHLPAGKYHAIAFSDKNGSLNYQPGEEYIGFLSQPVAVPQDREIHLVIFKEPIPFKIEDLTQRSMHHWSAAYKGTPSRVTVEIPKKKTNSYLTSHALEIWVNPVSEGDTLDFRIYNDTTPIFKGTRIAEDKKKDTLLLQFSSSEITPADTLFVRPTIPVIRADTQKIKIEPDIPFSFVLTQDGRPGFVFNPASYQKNVSVRIFPGAITDFLGHTNPDTLYHSVRFTTTAQTGSLHVEIAETPGVPLIIQLENPRTREIVREIRLTEGQKLADFNYLYPGQYYIRIIYDTDNNGKWTPGNFEKGLQPEKVYKFPKLIEIRPLWKIKEKISLPVD